MRVGNAVPSLTPPRTRKGSRGGDTSQPCAPGSSDILCCAAKERTLLPGIALMSAVAEPHPRTPSSTTSWPRRNAMVLAVAQALAGGNNTVIVSTASIVGAVLAPDKGLATLPITCMVLGMWVGTLPIGWLARHFGRRFALQSGSAFGMLSGLISYSAVMSGSFWLLLLGTFCGGLYAAAHQSYRFAAADTASEAFRPKVVSWVLAGGVFAARDRAAARHLHQGSCCRRICSPRAISASPPARVLAAHRADVRAKCRRSPPKRVEHVAAARRDRAHAALHRRGRLRRRQLRHDEHGDDLGAARHGRLRPFGHRRRRSAFSGTCWRCMRRASSPAV